MIKKNKIIMIVIVLIVFVGCNSLEKYKFYKGSLVSDNESVYTSSIEYKSPYSNNLISISNESKNFLKNKDIQLLRKELNNNTQKYINCVESQDKIISCFYNNKSYYTDDDYYVPEIKIENKQIVITHKDGEYTSIPFIILKGDYKKFNFKNGKISNLEDKKLKEIKIKFYKSKFNFKSIEKEY